MPQYFAIAIALCVPLSNANATTIGFSSPFYFGLDGVDLPTQIMVSQLPSGVQVGAFDITFQFNAAALNFSNFVFGPNLGDPAVSDVIESVLLNAPGTIEVAALSLLSASELQTLQGGGFPLGTLVLRPFGGQSSNVTITGLISDAFGNPLGTTFTRTQVSATPEPVSGLMLFFGLAAVAAAAGVPRCQRLMAARRCSP